MEQDRVSKGELEKDSLQWAGEADTTTGAGEAGTTTTTGAGRAVFRGGRGGRGPGPPTKRGPPTKKDLQSDRIIIVNSYFMFWPILLK